VGLDKAPLMGSVKNSKSFEQINIHIVNLKRTGKKGFPYGGGVYPYILSFKHKFFLIAAGVTSIGSTERRVF